MAKGKPLSSSMKSPAPATADRWGNIQNLLDSGGDISLGEIPQSGIFAITASDDAQCLAMLKRRENESLVDMLDRLDEAIGYAWENEQFIDEINR